MEETNKTGTVPRIFYFIGLAFCTIFTFIGLIYVLHGNIPLSAFLSLLVLTALAILSSYLTYFKTKKGKKTNFLPEYILGGAYFLVFLISFPFIFHFIEVDFSRKDELIRAGTDRVNMITQLKAEYEMAIDQKVNSFSDSVKTYLSTYLLVSGKAATRNILISLLGVNTVNFSDYEQRHNNSAAIEKLKADIEVAKESKITFIRAKYDLGNVNTESQEYCDKVLPVFESWRFLKVSYYYYDIGNMHQKVCNAAVNKMPDFLCTQMVPPDTDLENALKSVFNASILKIGLFFLVALLINLCILAPYLASHRPDNGPRLVDASEDEIRRHKGLDINKIHSSKD